MTKNAILPMESCRLTQYAMPVPCYICETGNTYDAEFCSHCYAPMALAHQANSQSIRPRLIAAIGASDAGKTVYLGMLMDMLSRQPDRLQLLARGAFSITLQQITVFSLTHCEFPQKTANEPDRWNWVHCQVRRCDRKEASELIMPDMAGEAVLQEVDHPYSYRLIRAFLQRCMGALIFADAVKLQDGRLEQDHFTMKLLSYLGELNGDWKNGVARLPVALVLTKADQCEECLEDPEGFARSHASGLWHQCQERFRCHRFFATGVAGACGYRDLGKFGRAMVPLRIEPRGIVEPFLWLLEMLEKTSSKR